MRLARSGPAFLNKMNVKWYRFVIEAVGGRNEGPQGSGNPTGTFAPKLILCKRTCRDKDGSETEGIANQ